MSSIEKPTIPIVDEHDVVIGEGDRHSLGENDIYRVSAVLIFNLNKELLIAQRKFTKKKDPGLWGPSVAGTVELGETYLENAIKETEEEVGATGLDLIEIGKVHETEPFNFFCQFFGAKTSMALEDFTPQEDEVEQLAWANLDQLSGDVRAYPNKYVRGMPRIVAMAEEFIK